MQPPPDQTLVSDFYSGNIEAFGTMITRYRKDMYRVIKFIVNDHEITQDLVQDTCEKAFQKMRTGTYLETGNLKQWFTSIAYRKALDHLKKKCWYEQSSLYNEIISPEDDPEESLLREQLYKKLLLAIDTLPKNQRTAVLLHAYGGHRYKAFMPVDGNVFTTAGYCQKGLKKLRIYLQN